MPVVRVDGPKITDLERKRDFVQKVTEVASEYYQMPRESIVVVIQENPPENVGVGGQLIVDRSPIMKNIPE